MKQITVTPITMRTQGGRSYLVHVTIKLDEVNLSITGVEGALPSGNCLGGCGQILHDLKALRSKDYRLVDGWTIPKFRRLLNIWEQWHLNELHAGCEHQRAMGWEKDGYDKHPSESCPVCGYQYGTAWNFVPIPDDVIEWLFSLPKAIKPCPWNN